MGQCIVCGQKLSFLQGDEYRRCNTCMVASLWPAGHPKNKEQQDKSTVEMVAPKGPSQSHNVGTDSQSGVEHGVFTSISYFTAWAAAILGTSIGFIMMMNGLLEGHPEQIVLGLILIISSWISASVIGTLSEISRKLSHSDMPTKKTFGQEG